MMQQKITVLGDIGTRKMRFVVTPIEAGVFSVPMRRAVPKSLVECIQAAINCIKELTAQFPGTTIERIVLSISPHDHTDTTREARITKALMAHFAIPVVSQSSMYMGPLGELHFGAGLHFDNFLVHILGEKSGLAHVTSGNISLIHMPAEHAPLLRVSGEYIERENGAPAFDILDSESSWEMYARDIALEISNYIIKKRQSHEDIDALILSGPLYFSNPTTSSTIISRYLHGYLQGDYPVTLVSQLGDDIALFGASAYNGGHGILT